MRAGVLLVGFALVTTSSLHAQPSREDLVRNRRMDACIKQLQIEDRALRNGWSKHCGEDELDQELDNAGVDPTRRSFLEGLLASSPSGENDTAVTDCSEAPSRPAIPQTAQCGLASANLSASLRSSAAISIRLPNNKCARFIPVLLTNKTAFACNAVQSRIACVDWHFDASVRKTTIKLFAQRGLPSESTTISLDQAQLDSSRGNLSSLLKHPQFVLLPAMIKERDVITGVKKAVEDDKRKCTDELGKTRAACERRSVVRSDALFQEVVRQFRNPKTLVSKPEAKDDATTLVESVKALQAEGKLEQWALFLAISANEVGLNVSANGVSVYDPVYALSDAILSNSGLSFGAHQIDIGANGDDELKFFWNIVAAFHHQTPDPVVQSAMSMKECIQLPLRSMTVKALDLTYRAASPMTAALRKAEGKTAYNAHLKTYLAAEVAKMSDLRGFFKSSMMARILYADLKNQRGSGKRALDLVQELAPTQTPPSCSSVIAAEDRILSRLIWNDPDDHQDGETTYAIRYKNIRTIVRGNVANGGVANCS